MLESKFKLWPSLVTLSCSPPSCLYTYCEKLWISHFIGVMITRELTWSSVIDQREVLYMCFTHFFMFLSCPLQSSCMKCWNLGLYRECWYVNWQCFSVFFKLVAVPAKWFTLFYYILLAQQCCVYIKFQFFFVMDVSFSNQHFG